MKLAECDGLFIDVFIRPDFGYNWTVYVSDGERYLITNPRIRYTTEEVVNKQEEFIRSFKPNAEIKWKDLG